VTIGCGAVLPYPQPADVASAQVEFPGTTQADLDRGRAVYLRRCGSCHLLHQPGDLAPAKWPGVVAKMTPRAKLSAADAADVVRYLVILSTAPPRRD
jgi:mono/diheme cytochrome c family protein